MSYSQTSATCLHCLHHTGNSQEYEGGVIWEKVCCHCEARFYSRIRPLPHGPYTPGDATTIHVSEETFAKLDARRRAHGWTWDEYLEIIGSLEEAFDE